MMTFVTNAFSGDKNYNKMLMHVRAIADDIKTISSIIFFIFFSSQEQKAVTKKEYALRVRVIDRA